jgi:signal transduction histidine kinase/DNA-binding response OmpR family regulator
MSGLFTPRSVRLRLLLIIFTVNFATLVAAGGALLYRDVLEQRNVAANDLSTLAGILSQGSEPALEFDEPKTATENLAQLRANPDVVAAAIYTSKGALFAHYIRSPDQLALLPSAAQADSATFSGGALTVFRRIGTDTNRLGTIYIKEQYDLARWLRDYLAIFVPVLLGGMVFGLLISSRLQRRISVPILAVSDVARQVMEKRNFALRAAKRSDDEIGQLADAFNGMLQTLEHEISERNTAELAVRTLNADLERRVADRTTELMVANQALGSRTADAEDANRAKANFLANMSHEIRTPMNAILGFAYLLERDNLGSESANLVTKIRNAGRSLQSIINDILDFSKIEAGHLEIERAPFQLADVLDNLAGIMAANAGDKEVELVVSPPPFVGGQLMGDVLRLEQVLINLTGNAIKFTERGSIMVGISLLSRDEKTATMRFSVKDSGIGIPMEKQAQIFAAFSQADISTTRRFGGTGLGLTICRHLVSKMGGTIGVISEPGRGSEFWFTIPFELDARSEYGPSELAALDVLIVDDNDVARENLALMGRALGWSSTVAESGETALHKVRSKHDRAGAFDLLLVDWQMPGMDGLEAAVTIRREMGDNTTPIILMVTAFARDSLLRQPGVDCVDAVLSKPVTSSALYDSVANVLKQRGRGIGASHRRVSQQQGRRIPGVRVLVVDDSDINREVALRILAADGATVSVAGDGASALAWLRANPGKVDIILMDVQMPVMDGHEATAILRATPELAHLPVIALTAGAFKAQQDLAREAGMNDFVAKPFNVDELMAAITRLTKCVPEAYCALPPPDISAEPELARFTSLAGIDIAKGMDTWRVFGEYRKFLQKFALDYANCVDRFAAHLAAGELEAAGTLVHKLKGAAGSLALPAVFNIAREIDGCTDAVAPMRLVPRLRVAMDEAFASIALLGADQQPLDAQLDAAQAAPLLANLLSALDTDAPDRANKILAQLAQSLPSGALAPIQDCLDNFDFRAAEAMVRQLSHDFAIELKE